MSPEPLLSFPRRGRYGVLVGQGEGLCRGRLEEEVVGGRRDVPCESAGTSKGLTLSDRCNHADSEFEGWADSWEKQVTDHMIFFEPEESGSLIHN